jgi:hypothetical protein
MADSVPTKPSAAPFLLAGNAVLCGVLAYCVYVQNQRIEALAAASTEARNELTAATAELTRIRIEQRSESKGPRALLDALRVWAPQVTNARVAEPQYQMAKAEIDAILKAIAAQGPDAYDLIVRRIDALAAVEGFDELKWLLEAAIAADRKRGVELVGAVLLGQRKPNTRLRWHAADLLMRRDLPVAQELLRRIVDTESCRGVNPDRAAPGTSVLDPAAIATTGFHNFITHYVRSGDPQMDETLVKLLGRSEHDLPTIQECVKVLGERKVAAAQKRIEELYFHPPVVSDNPIFACHCLEALARIRGDDAKPFFEAELKKNLNPMVLERLKHLLSGAGASAPTAATTRTTGGDR